MFRTIRGRLTAGSLLAVGLPLALFTYFLAASLWDFYLRHLEAELNMKALVIEDAAQAILGRGAESARRELPKLVAFWRRYSAMRVTIIDREGIIVAATAAENVGDRFDERVRPGLERALRGEANSMIWKSPNFGFEETMYVNMPIRSAGNGPSVGAVRVAYTVAEILRIVRATRTMLFAIVGVYALVIVLLTLGLARSIGKPVERLYAGAQRLAAGELGYRVEPQGTVELQMLGRALNQMGERLNLLEGLRREYVSNVSHELRTPLASIRMMAETLHRHGDADPQLSGKYLPQIISQTERLARLASQLIDLAEMESGNLVGHFSEVSLGEVFEEVAGLTCDAALRKGIELTFESEATLPRLSADRDRLVQVFLNLVDNAIRHTPSGGGVGVSASSSGSEIVVRVKDTGEGIPVGQVEHLFERFFRVEKDRSRRSGGSGLGLSIVKTIVDAHGGRVGVESTPGRGALFTVCLPSRAPIVGPSLPYATRNETRPDSHGVDPDRRG